MPATQASQPNLVEDAAEDRGADEAAEEVAGEIDAARRAPVDRRGAADEAGRDRLREEGADGDEARGR